MLQLSGVQDGAVGIDAGRVDSLLGRPPGRALPLACAFGVLLALALILLVAMLAGRTAASHATLALPMLSQQPCIVALALLPGTLAAIAASSCGAARLRPVEPPPPLHGVEMQVMEEVWRRGSVTVRDVMTALNARGEHDRAYTTYMTVLVRLHGKGLLDRRREGKTNHYTPAVARERYAASRVEADVQAVVEQHGDLALSEFARRVAGLDPERRAALERLSRGES